MDFYHKISILIDAGIFIVAAIGVNTWKKQIAGKSKHDVIRDTCFKNSEIMVELAGIRSNLSKLYDENNEWFVNEERNEQKIKEDLRSGLNKMNNLLDDAFGNNIKIGAVFEKEDAARAVLNFLREIQRLRVDVVKHVNSNYSDKSKINEYLWSPSLKNRDPYSLKIKELTGKMNKYFKI